MNEPTPLERRTVKEIVRSFPDVELVIEWDEDVSERYLSDFGAELRHELGPTWRVMGPSDVGARRSAAYFQARSARRDVQPHQLINVLEQWLLGRARAVPWTDGRHLRWDAQTVFVAPWQAESGALELCLYARDHKDDSPGQRVAERFAGLVGDVGDVRVVHLNEKFVPVSDSSSALRILTTWKTPYSSLPGLTVGARDLAGRWWTASWGRQPRLHSMFQLGVAGGQILQAPGEVFAQLVGVARAVAQEVDLEYATIAFQPTGAPFGPWGYSRQAGREVDLIREAFRDLSKGYPDAYPWQLVDAAFLGDLSGDWRKEQITDQLVEVSFPPIEDWRPEGLWIGDAFLFDGPEVVPPAMARAREALAPILRPERPPEFPRRSAGFSFTIDDGAENGDGSR